MPKRRLREKLWQAGYILLLFWPCFELACWIIGARPFRQIPYEIVSKPAGAVAADSFLGFSLRPGKYQVQINEGLKYVATHDSNGRRELGMPPGSSGPKIAFFGCSYTYGMGVNDNETFAALTQQAFPDASVYNYAVPGYGNVQGLLQLSHLFGKEEAPNHVVFCYADFHDHRNAMSPYYKRDLRLGFLNSSENQALNMQQSRFPYARTAESMFYIRHSSWAEESFYQKMRTYSASVNETLNFIERVGTERLELPDISLAVMQRAQKMCKANGMEFYVVGLTTNASTRNMLHKLDSLGITTADISVNLQDAAYNNLPHDSHPNAKAHKEMAKRLIPLLEAHLPK